MARFIYRGYHTVSGGGNPTLNTEQGVTPHAFLPGKPPIPGNMRDISPDLFSLYAANHLTNQHVLDTPFSSWSPDLGTALWFATGQFGGHFEDGATRITDPKSCFIAVIDTWTMFTDEERPYCIVPVGMIGKPSCGCEYLVYGPVRGPAYTVVSIADIQKAVGCPCWPYCPTRSPMPHPVTPGELQEALNMSKLFNRSKDMELTVFLAENSRQQWDSPNPGIFDHKLDPLQRSRHLNWNDNHEEIFRMMVFLSGCTELVEYKGTLPLFNKNTEAFNMGQLQLALGAMTVAEDLLKSGFLTEDITLTEEAAQIMGPFFRPQGHIHDCEDRARGHIMSFMVENLYRSGFLEMRRGSWE